MKLPPPDLLREAEPCCSDATSCVRWLELHYPTDDAIATLRVTLGSTGRPLWLPLLAKVPRWESAVREMSPWVLRAAQSPPSVIRQVFNSLDFRHEEYFDFLRIVHSGLDLPDLPFSSTSIQSYTHVTRTPPQDLRYSMPASEPLTAETMPVGLLATVARETSASVVRLEAVPTALPPVQPFSHDLMDSLNKLQVDIDMGALDQKPPPKSHRTLSFRSAPTPGLSEADAFERFRLSKRT